MKTKLLFTFVFSVCTLLRTDSFAQKSAAKEDWLSEYKMYFDSSGNRKTGTSIKNISNIIELAEKESANSILPIYKDKINNYYIPQLWLNIADIERMSDDPKKAIEDYNKVIMSKKPDEIWLYHALLGRGTCRTTLGKYELAMVDFDTAITIFPEKGDGYFRRGFAYIVYYEDKKKGCLDLEKAELKGNKEAYDVSLKWCK